MNKLVKFKNKSLIKGSVLAVAMALSQQALAGGIPVIDASVLGTSQMSIQQDAMNFAKDIAEQAKRLAEQQIQNQLSKLSLGALKHASWIDFKELARVGGVDEKMINTFESLLNGKIPSDLTDKARKYFTEITDICNQKGFTTVAKDLCRRSQYSAVAQIDYAEKLNNEINQKIKNIENLAQQVRQAQDVKAVAEVQAQLQAELTSVQLLKLQSDNFQRMQEAQKEIADKQARDYYEAERRKTIEAEYRRINSWGRNSSQKTSNTTYRAAGFLNADF